MKILLVDNHTLHLPQLFNSLEGHDVEVQEYRPGLEFHNDDKDLIILSGGGGEGLEIVDKLKKGKLWYDDEIDFVKDCDMPVIGICMGFEIMAKARGSEVKYYGGELIHGELPITANEEGKRIFGQQQLKQVEAHRWYVDETPKDMIELARSKTGVEAFLDKSKKQLGVQFHPEEGGTIDLRNLISVVS
jgi:GMP synthase-like glutamine amidotransferase